VNLKEFGRNADRILLSCAIVIGTAVVVHIVGRWIGWW